MGLFDRIQDGVNRGIGETERLLEVGKLKTSVSNLSKEREKLLFGLGRATYELHRRGEREIASLAEACESVRQIELEIAQLEQRIAELAGPRSESTFACPTCGAPAMIGASFCSTCGKAIEAPPKRLCSHCGAELPEDGKFCVRCGTSAASDDAGSPEEGVVG